MALKVLFVCVENSCRSQMAEGLGRKLGLDCVSAGSRPSGKVNPAAVQAMRERGIDISKHVSKSLDDVRWTGWDCVITMGCGDACPHIPAKTRLDWKVPDPKGMPIDAFHETCDLLEGLIRELVKTGR